MTSGPRMVVVSIPQLMQERGNTQRLLLSRRGSALGQDTVAPEKGRVLSRGHLTTLPQRKDTTRDRKIILKRSRSCSSSHHTALGIDHTPRTATSPLNDLRRLYRDHHDRSLTILFCRKRTFGATPAVDTYLESTLAPAGHALQSSPPAVDKVTVTAATQSFHQFQREYQHHSFIDIVPGSSTDQTTSDPNEDRCHLQRAARRQDAKQRCRSVKGQRTRTEPSGGK
jgi:hypothetical protein